MNITIRKEHPNDIQAIHDVTVSAFLNAPHTGHTEQFIVKALREARVLSISLVAEVESQIVGHIALSPVTISDGSMDWYGLGPISVIPEYQGKGVGSVLMKEAIAALKALNANGCVLLGDHNYYKRFGFAPKDGLILPEVPAEYFQALVLQGELPKGNVAYHDAFLATA
ncbi:N-acetyltransferase [Psychrobium sp. MM17-31]|uniref:GNAT family N-acetyltransferase n=1 Tax=Psychrobium sp. MM17-31 TaxID=2917758 RepID=UPI001EF48DB7|nr:N-acetyltransferase [Psychrobium sp. MM17-31]MCG7530672.1 N-acetyltransferase [Psychrobium sp. MM17-31]